MAYIHFIAYLKNENSSHSVFGEVLAPFWEDGIHIYGEEDTDIFKWGNWTGWWTGLQWTARHFRVAEEYVKYIKENYNSLEVVRQS